MAHIKRPSKLVVGALAIAVLSLTSSVFVYASFFGRGDGEGYFKGNSESGGWESKYNVIHDGLNKSDGDSATKLYNFIKGRYDNGSTQDQVGAAFIANTMMGNKAPGTGKTVSPGDWSELKDRLISIYMNGSVDWKSFGPCGEDSSYYQTSNKDDAFYNLSNSVQSKHLGFNVKSKSLTSSQKKKLKSFCSDHDVLQFKYNGKVVYRLDKDCANPIGDAVTIPKAKKWFISASSSKNMASAAPGQTIVWTHKVKNDGPDDTTDSIHSNVVISGFSNGWNGTRADGDTGSGKGKGTIRTITDYATYGVTQNDVGNSLCQKVQYDPTDWKGGSNGSGSKQCVDIPYNYSLASGIGVISDVVDPDSTTAIPGVVTNNGPTKSKGSEWRITQVILEPGKPKPNEFGGNNGADPCPNFFTPGFGNGTCAVIASGINKVFNANGANPDGSVKAALIDNSISASGVIGDLEVGQKVCYALSLRDRSSSSSQWSHSPLVCQTVGKKPKVQIWAGDLSTQGSVQTINTVKTIAGKPTTFGSWSEYGIFASFSVNGMGSGSAFAGTGMANATIIKSSALSFANTNNAGCITSFIGCYKMTRAIPDVAASFPGAGTTINLGSIVPNDLIATGTYIGTRTGNLILTKSDLDPGKSIILKVSGTVTIAGNQTYNPDNKGAKYINGAQLPQLVIIADRIVINDTVTNVDAWLVGSGVSGIVETCNTGSLAYILNAAPIDLRLTSNKCNQPLVVNGPVMARQLWLRRTAGSGAGAASGDPAEVFNLRADTYLWAMARAISNGHIQTVHTTEVPPRF